MSEVRDSTAVKAVPRMVPADGSRPFLLVRCKQNLKLDLYNILASSLSLRIETILTTPLLAHSSLNIQDITKVSSSNCSVWSRTVTARESFESKHN